jgi:hypothetical protein
MAATIVGPVTQPLGNPGGLYAALNVTTAQALSTSQSILCAILIVAPGSAGSLTINDCATTGAASAANTIFTALYTSLTVGQVIVLNWPCGTGLTVSAIPTAGQISMSFTP